MGEKSKKIGEIGENIVNNFFSLLGWDAVLQDQEIACKKKKKHARKTAKKGERRTHGIDFLFCYKSPLEGSTAESAVISVKHSEDPYPNSPKNKFNEHFEDIALTLECYKNSELKKEQQDLVGGTTKCRDIGILFWLSSNDNTYDNVVTKLTSYRPDSEWRFEYLHLIDNRRIQFIYETMTYLRKNKNRKRLFFYYPESSLNYEDKTINRYGKICPIDFLTSPVIPLIVKAKNKNDQDLFCISSIDNFDHDTLRRLIQAAKEYTQDISCNYLFLFPNYVKSHHSDIVKRSVTGLGHGLFDRIQVASYKPDFRGLDNE